MSNEKATEDQDAPPSPEIHFEPIVNLPKVELKSLEENEEALLKLRAKLFRFETSGDENEWKERGVGEVKILKHSDSGRYRVLMRRDKTLKICANHYITKDMDLQPNCGSDRAWVWKADDYADEALKRETLAIRFANAENAKKFKEAFEDCQSKLDEGTDEQESNKLAKELEGLQVKESSEEKSNKSEESESVCEDKKRAESETSEIAPSEESKEPSSSGAE
ncbi:Ran-specific GTPase-activating protein [Acropora cervicornis]|uniref:Ran-specific GTPase-activating protein n=1 Tax=Acropora cervicornis TaxID=6130 RepID=A0AAD9R827_ACRCE|nr:Ran-specific GTPase-activating protein [Acropora cervicornis]